MTEERQAESIGSPDHVATGRGSALFGRRVAGFVIDYALGGAAWAAICFGLWALLVPRVYTRTAFGALIVVALLVPTAALFAYWWAGNALGWTIGKRVVGLRVVAVGTRANAGLLSGLVRTLMAWVSGNALGFGYISAAWDRDGQTWHDKVARTIVVDAGSADGATAIDHHGRVRRATPLLMGTLAAGAVLIVLALLGWAFATDSVQVFNVEGAAMEPTYSDGDTLIVLKGHSIDRGDVISFQLPLDPSRRFIKRVIGMPGETVEVRDEKVYINGEALVEDYILAAPNYTYGPKVVPPKMYFVLGDNRRNSWDSHAWGNVCPADQQCEFVPESYVLGLVLR